MILDLRKFIAEETPYWQELDDLLRQLDRNTVGRRLTLPQVKRLHYLYQRASADLARVSRFSVESPIRRYLESLVARAYSEVHEVRGKAYRIAPLTWLFRTFPQTFRCHIRAFALSVSITLLGVLFGGAALSFDPDAKAIIMPFSHLHGDPSERVEQEEENAEGADRLQGRKAQFSAYLMTHNTKVSIFTFAMGITWGIGTILLLFYNGVILGAVALDYILAGETTFLVGWLLPHGAIEIPAILLAGQAGFVLAGAFIGWGRRISLRARLQHSGQDLVTLLIGVALMLVWAGLIEAFLSQYHEPVIPYALKISFGVLELVGLIIFLAFSGQNKGTG